MLVGKRKLELVGGFDALFVAERSACAHRTECLVDIDFPTLCVIVGDKSAVITNCVIVEVATPCGDESACIHFVIILHLWCLSKFTGLVNPLIHGAEWVLGIEHIEVGEQRAHDIRLFMHLHGVGSHIGRVKLRLLVAKEIAEQFTTCPNQIHLGGIHSHRLLLEQQLPSLVEGFHIGIRAASFGLLFEVREAVGASAAPCGGV